MYEFKSKRSGAITPMSDEDYEEIVRNGVIDLSRYEITKLNMRSVIPAMKEIKAPKEVVITKKTKKNEG